MEVSFRLRYLRPKKKPSSLISSRWSRVADEMQLFDPDAAPTQQPDALPIV